MSSIFYEGHTNRNIVDIEKWELGKYMTVDKLIVRKWKLKKKDHQRNTLL
jgi:hypothetical protein